MPQGTYCTMEFWSIDKRCTNSCNSSCDCVLCSSKVVGIISGQVYFCFLVSGNLKFFGGIRGLQKLASSKSRSSLLNTPPTAPDFFCFFFFFCCNWSMWIFYMKPSRFIILILASWGYNHVNNNACQCIVLEFISIRE